MSAALIEAGKPVATLKHGRPSNNITHQPKQKVFAVIPSASQR